MACAKIKSKCSLRTSLPQESDKTSYTMIQSGHQLATDGLWKFDD
jgi:hypothetical protein